MPTTDVLVPIADVWRTAVQVGALEMAERDYNRLVSVMRTMFGFRSSKRALRALADALLDHGALDGRTVARVIEKATYGLPQGGGASRAQS